jgi:hypothetical protein
MPSIKYHSIHTNRVTARHNGIRNVVATVGGLVMSMLASVAPCAAQSVPTNFAATLRWHGYIDTDLKFAEFFQHDHTIAARFIVMADFGKRPMRCPRC